MVTSPSISVQNLSVDYGGAALFKGFSCTIEGGRTTCLLGPSGCGKSTLLGAISGNTAIPHEGSISFGSIDGYEGGLSWMAQDDLLLPWYTVLDNVLLGARLRREVTEEKRERAKQLIDRAGLTDSVSKYPDALSGGMRQRVALLRTLMEDRSVILMDEPFSALDALTRMKLQDLAAGMTRGRTVLLVTHDPMEALRMGDRVMVLGGSPIGVISQIELKGSTPRSVEDREVADQYPKLLREVLGEKG